MNTDGSRNGGNLQRKVHRRYAGGVKRIAARPVKPKELRHRFAVERPACAVKHGAAHRAFVVTGKTFIETRAVPQKRRCKAQKVMRVAVGLSSNAVCVVGNNRIAVRGRKAQKFFDHGVKRLGDSKEILPVNGYTHRRQNVLA